MKDTFHSGDKIFIKYFEWINRKYRGQKGTVLKWCHDNIYIVTMDTGQEITVCGFEMEPSNENNR